MTSSDVVTSLGRRSTDRLEGPTSSVFCMSKDSDCCDDRRRKNNSMEVVVEDRKLDVGLSKGSSSIRLLCGGYSTQHAEKGGCVGLNADAFLLSRRVIGVADGVSAVEGEGYNPSLLPKELLRECFALAQERNSRPTQFKSETKKILAELNNSSPPIGTFPNARQVPSRYDDENDFTKFILARALSRCSQMGSTTCCLAIAQGSVLHIVNVGDSQMVVLRQNKGPDKSKRPLTFVGKTSTQQHFFNCPYQLTRMPDVDCDPLELTRRCLEVADLSRFDLEVGDIIVGGTDGLYDNLFLDPTVLSEVSRAVASGPPTSPQSPYLLAKRLVNLALSKATPTVFDWDVSRAPDANETPFSVALSSECRRPVKGGKPDDTTALIAFVVSPSDPSLNSEKSKNNFDKTTTYRPARPIRKPPEPAGASRDRQLSSQSSNLQFLSTPTVSSSKIKKSRTSMSRLFSHRLTHRSKANSKSSGCLDVEETSMVTPRFRESAKSSRAPLDDWPLLSSQLSRQSTSMEVRAGTFEDSFEDNFEDSDSEAKELSDIEGLFSMAESKPRDFFLSEPDRVLVGCQCLLCHSGFGCANCRPKVVWVNLKKISTVQDDDQLTSTPVSQSIVSPVSQSSASPVSQIRPSLSTMTIHREDIRGETVRDRVEALESSKKRTKSTRQENVPRRTSVSQTCPSDSNSSDSILLNTSLYASPIIW